MNALIAWKNKPGRKPLILQGGWQVGKTGLVSKIQAITKPALPISAYNDLSAFK